MERNPLHDLTKDELVALVLESQDQLAELARFNREQAKQIEELSRRLEELEKRNPTPRLDEAYSMKAEEKRQADAQQGGNSKRKKQKSKRRGRISKAEKLAQATMHQDIWPVPHPLKECRLKYSRPVWRIIDGRAVLVAYHIYAGPDGRVPQIPGVPKRSEFGQEIIVALSWQHYILGLSLDKVIAEQAFFWGLRLSKSQADALLNQLAKAWLPEFDALCQLLAVSAVVYADETSWSINSVWTFLSERARLTIFGCHKDGETLAVLLKKDEFKGVLVSDDAAVYQGFDRAQKCWAHLIRKAIRLTLLKPNCRRYRQFLDELLEIYRRGKAIAADGRLSEAGRRKRVAELVNAVCNCTGRRFADQSTPQDDVERDFFNLTHEIVRLLGEDELFTYAIYPEVAGTNNESERELRDPAQDRATGQTNKTGHGARRRTVITSVLNSLQLYIPQFTLQTVLAELSRWQQVGISCFRRVVDSLNLPPLKLPENVQSPLELLVPILNPE
jgi:hypothetical protein